ncbi:MAG: alanine--tRNA ligase, partial [Planctomycetaceae bacterium]|nr:alanine--tRNA ligase [Planctomycetaceae bacterium]
PELGETVTRVAQVIEKEEANFLSTIDAGLDRLERILAEAKRENRTAITGREAADMYTTHGFPPELFQTLAAEHNLTFDWDGFRREMEQHGLESGGGQRIELFQSGPLDALKKTMPGTEFLGYDATTATGKIVGIIAQNELCDTLDEVGHAEPVTVILDRTPFYGESGGQVGDTGELRNRSLSFEVIDTQRDSGFILHRGHLRVGKLDLGDEVTAVVDAERRAGIRRAHSATHLLHFALQKHLGPHAQQQGSKVDRDWLRFDFTHPKSVTAEELTQIESEVNQLVGASAPVNWCTLPIAEARQAGAMMLFGEKYPDVVRMVTMGDFSKELCGGTHLENTMQTGLFMLVGEESVAAGTRRITAVTGDAARQRLREHEQVLAETAATLRVPVSEIPARVAALLKEVRELKKQSTSGKVSGASADALLAEAVDVGGVKVVAAEVPGGNTSVLRQLIDQLRKKGAPIAVLLASREAGKVTLVAGISRDLQERGANASKWIATPAEIVGGRGGGHPDMAQAGGKLDAELPKALEAARAAAKTLVP